MKNQIEKLKDLEQKGKRTIHQDKEKLGKEIRAMTVSEIFPKIHWPSVELVERTWKFWHEKGRDLHNSINADSIRYNSAKRIAYEITLRIRDFLAVFPMIRHGNIKEIGFLLEHRTVFDCFFIEPAGYEDDVYSDQQGNVAKTKWSDKKSCASAPFLPAISESEDHLWYERVINLQNHINPRFLRRVAPKQIEDDLDWIVELEPHLKLGD